MTRGEIMIWNDGYYYGIAEASAGPSGPWQWQECSWAPPRVRDFNEPWPWEHCDPDNIIELDPFGVSCTAEDVFG